MFEGLKKKFSSFIDSITKKEEEEVRKEEQAGAKAPVSETPQVPEAREERPSVTGEGKPEPVAAREEHKERTDHALAHTVAHEKAETIQKAEAHKEPERKEVRHEAQREERSVQAKRVEEIAHAPRMEYHVEVKPKAEIRPKEEHKPHVPERKEPVAEEAVKPVEIKPRPQQVHEEKQKLSEQKVTLGTRLKGIVFREVTVSQKDIDPFIEQLRIALLQSDVNYDVTEKILQVLQSDLTSRPISAKDLSNNITSVIRDSIMKVLVKGSGIDIVALAKSKKSEASGEPFRILFIGPNGAGKTTAMAKVAKMMMNNGLSCVLSASDTFRAAAIEQTVHHANKLGIHAIKGTYGADPASVAFDAIAYAKAHGIDVVLIDSAGRQETNKSLMEEIKKMVRISKPDLKVFVGESIVGNALLGQVKEFDQTIKLDGIILTKLDCDAKGGNTLSILSDTTIPILYFGIGEGYNDIMAYDPNFIMDNIVPNN